jgi:cysteine-rich repeat protein
MTCRLLVALLVSCFGVSVGCSSDPAAVDLPSDIATSDTGEPQPDAQEGGGEDGSGDSDAGSDTADAEPEVEVEEGVEPLPDLGRFCPFGCTLNVCADTSYDDCSSEVCLHENGRSYCTQTCENGECPEAYFCVSADDDTGDWCAANPAVCGNGVTERTEACDDGNTEGRDLCSPDCSEVTTIPSFGSFRFGAPGSTGSSFEGDEPRVYGYRSVFDDGRTELVVGTSINDNFAVVISDIDTLVAPYTGPAGASSVFSVCNFLSQSATVTVTEHDVEDRVITGSFETLLSCWANCFDCGGDGEERIYEGEFSVNYVDRPF